MPPVNAEASLLSEMGKMLLSQGPAWFFLAVGVFVFTKYWLIPKTAAEVESIKQNAQSLSAIATANGKVVQMMEDQGKLHIANQKQMRTITRYCISAMRASVTQNKEQIQAALASLEGVLEQGDG